MSSTVNGILQKPNYVNCCSHNLYTCQRSGQVCKMRWC